MYIVIKKLQFLKSILKIYNIDVFGNVCNLVNTSKVVLDNIHDQIYRNGYSDELKPIEKLAKIEL